MKRSSVVLVQARDHAAVECQLAWECNTQCVLELTSAEYGNCQAVGDDLFECLRELRRRLDPKDIRILCNGARVDAYPSRMCREMGRGRKLYILTLGKPPDSSDLICIFDHAQADRIGTVAEQRGFYERWLRSLR